MPAVTPTVYVVDDDPGILTALGRVLSAAGHRFETHSNAVEFLQKHDPDIPGCAVLDLEMPGMDGFGVQASLSTTDRPVIFLTGHATVPASVRAMKAGAIDFLMKPVEASTLLAAVSIALQRDFATRQQAEERRSVDQRIASLTPREREVLAHVLDGRLNKQIAGILGIVEKTVKVHRHRVMEKMGARTVADLVRVVTKYPA